MKKTGLHRLLKAVAAVLVASVITASGIYTSSAKEDVPVARTWKTKDGKHSVEAVLVEHSVADVTLKLKNGKNKTIKLSLLADETASYLKGFPSLAGKADPKNLPWLRLETKSKNQKSGAKGGGFEQSARAMEVTMTSRSKETLEVDVLYGYLTSNLKEKGGRQRAATAEDLLASNFTSKKITLDGQKETKFLTDAIYNTSVNGNSDMSMKGSFVVQVYWKGELLQGWTAQSKLRDMARDGTLLKKFRGR